MPNRFIADVHLGKLARLLRLLGFDTAYENNFTNQDLASIALEQSRILLTRNTYPSKQQSLQYFIIKNEDPSAQLKQVVEHFNLKNEFYPFSRCVVCNGILEIVSKEKIIHLLEENTVQHFDKFWQCSNCRRIYWKGSHYDRMLQRIKKMIDK